MKTYTSLIIFLSSFMLSSCFEIIEEVTLNDDGSGNVSMTLNFSKSKTKINSLMLMDSINNHRIPSRNEIETKFIELQKEIKKIKGVSSLKSSSNFEDYIFSLSCNFKNINVLNNIISHFSSAKDARIVHQQNHFKYNTESKIFDRRYHYDLAKELSKVNTKDKEVVEGASMTTIYHFESEILSSKNKNARIAGNNKAIMLRVSANDILSKKNTIKNTIQLKQ